MFVNGATTMQEIFDALQRLDQLYHADNLSTYEQYWQDVCKRIETLYPGFTLAYAEIYSAGSTREPLGSMRHVLLPIERNAR